MCCISDETDDTTGESRAGGTGLGALLGTAASEIVLLLVDDYGSANGASDAGQGEIVVDPVDLGDAVLAGFDVTEIAHVAQRVVRRSVIDLCEQSRSGAIIVVLGGGVILGYRPGIWP